APAGPTSRLDCDFHYPIQSLAKQIVRVADFVERESMRQQRRQIDATMTDHLHQSAHALLTTGTQRRNDAVIANAGRECSIPNLQIAPAHTETPQGSCRTHTPHCALQRPLRAECSPP